MAEPETTFRRRTSLQNQGMEKLDIERARRASEAGAEPLIVPPSSSLRLFAVEQEGEELFKEFVREQVRWEHCEELAARSPVLNCRPTPPDPGWGRTGAALKRLAEEFAQSKERQQVRDHAISMSFAELDVSGFTSLLDELLHGDNGSITREKIVVLFFFCSDLAIHHLKASMMDLFERCISWSLQFIVKHVCGWVQKHGGWETVLSTSFRDGVKLLLLAGAVCAGLLLIKRQLT